MAETAINVPFEAGEIIHIIAEELQTRMRGLSPLQGSKEYAAFAVDFQVKIRLRRAGETAGDERETLAWGKVEKHGVSVDLDAGTEEHEDTIIEHHSTLQSRDPNEERVSRDMPLTVEGTDGKGGKARRKVRVKG